MNKQNDLGIARRSYDNAIRDAALKHEICADILHDHIVKTAKQYFGDDDEAESCTLHPLSTDETQELIRLWRRLCSVEMQEYIQHKRPGENLYIDRPIPPLWTVEKTVRPEDILEEALRLTSDDRNKLYGPPQEDFARTAKLWSALLNVPIQAKDVALCMIALKLSRAMHSDHRDHYTDIAGYARCGWLCTKE